MKMQIFEKDEANKVMLQKLRDEQVKSDDAKRLADLKRKKLREMKEEIMRKKEEANASDLGILLEEMTRARREQEEAAKEAER